MPHLAAWKCNLVFSLKIGLITKCDIASFFMANTCSKTKNENVGLLPSQVYWKRMDDHSKNAN